MTFTTLTFLLFLLVVFALYWGFPQRRFQNLLLVISSYVFYGWWDWRFCSLMLASSLLDYYVGLGLDASDQPRRRKMLLSVALVGNLGMLGFFKYFNFFSESLAAAASSLGWNFDRPTLDVVLPVGISFYTFQTMSYSIDIYRREMRASRQFIEYLAYVSFFPQLVAGPIERATHLLPQFLRDRRFNYEKAADGCRQMLWGFFKKMVVADNLATAVDLGFSQATGRSGPELLVATFFFAVQIYCDFSAYSDIASGTARLFGIELMKNFNCPYFAGSMRDFWRRWHISLSTWFRDYVYVPLGGGRVSRGRKAANVMATFILSGLWHGAAWNFIAWGALHGAAVLPESLRAASRKPAPALALIRIFKTLLVFTLVCLGWVLFRARNLSEAMLILKKIIPAPFKLESWPAMLFFGNQSEVGETIFVVIVGLFALEWLQRHRAHPLAIHEWSTPLRWTVYFVMAGMILLFGTYNNSAFIYFQF
jgi:alginate O-acetyltransferase complex protein AlgI